MESVYIAEASSTDDAADMETSVQYQHPYFYIGSIVWHPEDNGLLVSTYSKTIYRRSATCTTSIWIVASGQALASTQPAHPSTLWPIPQI